MMRRWVAVALVAALGSVPSAWAQPPQGGGAAGDRDQAAPDEGEAAAEGEQAEAAEAPEGAEATEGVDEAAEGEQAEAPEGAEATEGEDEAATLAGGEDEGGEAAEASEALPPVTAPVGPRETAAGPATDEGGGSIPLDFHLNGYYRSRAVWTGNVPVPDDPDDDDRALEARNAYYLFQRLRLEPSVTYGSDPDNPIAALYTQIDALDNVVWGDNALEASTPLFAADPSSTDVFGEDIPSVRLERAWLQFLIPVGQVRVGRMPSQWGLGILTTDGNGLGEWGDPMIGTTYDRVLFATRPLTIYNALSKGDARPTPLIVAVAYDKLVEEPSTPETDPPRSRVPFEFLTHGADDVQETVAALLWNDPDVNPDRASDELTAGLYFVNRWQNSTESDVYILDAFWKLRYALGARAPSLYLAGEVVNISGSDSRALPFAGGCGEDDAPPCNQVSANIWGAVARAGLIDRDDAWTATLEGGYASGDEQYFDDNFTVRPLHPDYHVGLLLYQVAMASKTAIGISGLADAEALWSQGGVWNSWYLWPQARYTVLPGVEVHGAFLLAWADKLTPDVYQNPSDTIPPDADCGLFDGKCFIGWEADLALRLKWGEDDLMWWDTELGLMNAGDALTTNEIQTEAGPIPLPGALSESLLWTIQTRIAMRF